MGNNRVIDEQELGELIKGETGFKLMTVGTKFHIGDVVLNFRHETLQDIHTNAVDWGKDITINI